MHALHYAYSKLMMQCINTPAPELTCEIKAGTFCDDLDGGCRHRVGVVGKRVGIVDVEKT